VASWPEPAHRHDPVVLLFSAGNREPVTSRRVAGAYGPGYRPIAAAPAAPPSWKASRTLTAGQQQAWSNLVAMGATLPADFTNADLKRAFKHLARVYHPDRHPGCSEFERARLARQFAMLHDAYRQLLTAVPLPPAA